MQLSNTHVKELRRLRYKKYRRLHRLFFIEGLRLCEEALKVPADVEELIVCPSKTLCTRTQNLLNLAQQHNIPIREATPKQLQALAMTESPSGLFAVVKQKSPPPMEDVLRDATLLLALDGIADPGNLGTILRTACWFGVKNVFLSASCVEAHNEKTVRGAMGAHFYLNLFEDVHLLDVLRKGKANSFRILSAVVEKATTLASVNSSAKNIVIIGNEAHGISPDLMKIVDIGITIPRIGYGESLNAAIAAGIILYVLTQRS